MYLTTAQSAVSEIFGETVDKKHFKSILEGQSNRNIIFADSNVNSNILGSGCIINNSDQPNFTPDKSQPTTPDFQQNNNNQIKQEKIEKLRELGLSDQEIAEILDLPLEAIKQPDIENKT